MKLIRATATNFGSYSSMDFDYQNKGLALIHGATGSGKSTLQDVAPWVLFGITAKDGNADEIRSWSNLEDLTIGVLEVIARDGTTITICRSRGKPSENDLFWEESGWSKRNKGSVPFRGKDITDTQKLLNERLQINPDLYIAAAYFNEFSPTGNFFTAKAKERRELFEKLTDLKVPKLLAERCTDAKKDTKKLITETKTKIDKATGRSEQLTEALKTNTANRDAWELKKAAKIKEIEARSANFEAEKVSQIKAFQTKADVFESDKHTKLLNLQQIIEKLQGLISSIDIVECPTCKQSNTELVKATVRLQENKKALAALQKTQNPHSSSLRFYQQMKNQFGEVLEEEESKANPFVSQIETVFRDLEDSTKFIESLRLQLVELEGLLSSLEQLYNISFILRSDLLKSVIKQIEDSTNAYLHDYFDSEIKVGFKLDESDNLEIQAQKSGYPCVYKQLSKGQRQLLKLCFSVSVMKVTSDNSGVHFSEIFFDEALDGLDSNLKVKAIRLLQELEKSYSSVFVVEHSSELKDLFDKKYHVIMEGDNSKIEED